MTIKKYHLYLNENEWLLIILRLNDLLNRLVAEGRYTHCVDEPLVKFAGAKTVTLKIRYTEITDNGKNNL